MFTNSFESYSDGTEVHPTGQDAFNAARTGWNRHKNQNLVGHTGHARESSHVATPNKFVLARLNFLRFCEFYDRYLRSLQELVRFKLHSAMFIRALLSASPLGEGVACFSPCFVCAFSNIA